jgi:type IV pilus assembly protein PilN
MIRINLAPPRESRRVYFRGSQLNLGLLFGAAALALVTVLGAVAWYFSHEERRLTAEVERSGRELTTLRTLVGPAAKMKERLAELQARLKAIEALIVDQHRPLSLVDAFADVVPTDLWITAFEEKATTLRVRGSAFSASAISNFMTALRASGKFRDVDIIVSKRDLDKAPNVVTFEVTCRFGT